MDLGPEWHDLFQRYGAAGAVAIIILIVLAYKSPALIAEFRKCIALIMLYREAGKTTADTLEDRRRRLDQRIKAAEAIESGKEASDDDK